MRKESGSTNLNTYITDHLPAKFQEQQKLLYCSIKKLRRIKRRLFGKHLMVIILFS